MLLDKIDVDLTKIIPLLKWVGGKRELVPEISKYYKNLEFNNYHEVFFGGGSVYIDIIKSFGIEKVKKSFINDINDDLINLLRDVKLNPNEVIENLYKLKSDYEEFGFYHIRDRFNGIDREKNIVEKYQGIERSSSLIVLNRTCFNGLYRTNKSGLFNVPVGSYKNPKIINEENILNLSEILPPINQITNKDFNNTNSVNKDDLVYFDPPYHPLNKTSSFTEYSGSFGENKQIELFNYFKELDNKGVFVILSNSSSEFIYDLYKEFNPFSVLCSRNINSKGTGRGKINEVIVIGNTLRNKLGL
jgi:DNA adenine methylase